MGCVYNDFEGKCQILWDDDKKEVREDTNCVDEEGHCVVDEDPNPECESFESLDGEECPECGEITEFDVCDCGYCYDCESSECECERE